MAESFLASDDTMKRLHAVINEQFVLVSLEESLQLFWVA